MNLKKCIRKVMVHQIAENHEMEEALYQNISFRMQNFLVYE